MLADGESLGPDRVERVHRKETSWWHLFAFPAAQPSYFLVPSVVHCLFPRLCASRCTGLRSVVSVRPSSRVLRTQKSSLTLTEGPQLSNLVPSLTHGVAFQTSSAARDSVYLVSRSSLTVHSTSFFLSHFQTHTNKA